MPADLAPPDPTRCPLCGSGNACAMEAARQGGAPPGPCWCVSVDFDAAQLQRAAGQPACLCAACAAPPQPRPS